MAAAIAAFLVPFMSSALNVALPAIGAEFELDGLALSWLATAFLLPLAALTLPMGRLADMKGRKRVFRAGIIVFVAATFPAVVSTGALFLTLMRVFQGIGGAMIFSTGVAMLATLLPVGRRGRALGLNVAAVYLGLTMGPFIGGFLVRSAGWRSVFILPAAAGGLLLWRVIPHLPNDLPQAEEEKFDYRGAFLLGAGLMLCLLGVSSLPGFPAFMILVAGIVILLLFVLAEKKTAYPLLKIKLFQANRVFALANTAALVHYSATFALSFLLSIQLQMVRGLSPQQTGLILVVQPVFQAAFSPLAGKISDLLEPRLLSFSGISLTAVGIFALALMPPHVSLWLLASLLALIGFGFALFSSPNTNAIMAAVTRHDFGVASATLSTMRVLGQMTSMALVTMIFALKIGRIELVETDPGKIMNSIRTIFFLQTILCACGAILSFFARKDRRGPGVA